MSLVTPDRSRVPLRMRSDDRGNFELFLPDSVFYELSVFDPDTGLIGHETGITSPSGQRTTLAGSMVFAASTEPDSDFDGLPDDVERTIGTSPRTADSDGDDISDFAELSQGLNPLDGRPTITGVVAALALDGPRTGHCPDSRHGNRRPTNRLPGARTRWTGRRGRLAIRSADSAGPARAVGRQRGRGSRTCRPARGGCW